MESRKRFTVFFCALAIMITPSFAQELPPTECSSSPASYGEFDANQLFEAFTVCSQSGDHKIAALLIALGQIRAITDMTILAPINEDEAQKVGKLYGTVYYSFGGLGLDEIFRDPDTVSTIVSSIRSANLDFYAGYDPGWSYKASSKTDIYDQVVLSRKSHRIWQIKNYALTMQNDAFYEAHQAHNKLRLENPVFKVDTPAYEESLRLRKLMKKASAEIEKLPAPADTMPHQRLNEPDADASFAQIGQGFNGPESGSKTIFTSEAEIRDSWLGKAYSTEQLDALIAEADFEKQALIAVTFGRRMNASGTILITQFEYSERSGGYGISAKIGVIPKSCGVDFAASYPFVLAVGDAVANAEIRSSSSSNFPDNCGPIRSGLPTITKCLLTRLHGVVCGRI
jgi:hypothetical protein